MTDELLTRREREQLAAIRRQKWEQMQAALPGLSDLLQRLNAPYTYRWRGVKNRPQEKHFPKGCEARITRCVIDGKTVVGQ